MVFFLTSVANPSSPPLPTGGQALEKGGITPLWQRGARGDFLERMFLTDSLESFMKRNPREIGFCVERDL